MKPFNIVWNDILSVLKENDHVVITLIQGKKNIVNKVTEDGFFVTTKSAPQLVWKEWIEDTWNALVKETSLTAEDIPGRARHRSSFIMALLAQLPYVKASKDPVAMLSLLNHEQLSYNRSLWGIPEIQFQVDEEEAALFPEGKRVYRQHRVIERNPNLIKAAKEYHKKRMNGEVKCMVCDFSFKEKYGQIGEDFIEGHHTMPISEITGEYNAKVEDIALVCSNCHRMLHRKRPWLNMDELKNFISRKED
ncbi:HNH endonuclease [Paenibacillus silviterrae]|uniref:HNH endonuclease n=1 Tax=Paenibacillus silviterrae TaxID=3242194 RepID=UPI002542FC7C|nr:HNH endonuclease [Paenibacillus chinjuensis]